MKKLIYIVLVMFFFMACKKEKNTAIESKPLSVAEKIANAHDFQNWEKVSQINFTFNVDRDSSHFERAWSWKPKTNEVSLHKKDTIINYKRNNLDSTLVKTDKGFINDKYWLLVPFQLIWDEGTTISEPVKEIAPISKVELNKIILTYGNKGGYTPGDAYDIFYGDNYLIKEWVFRESNQKEPSMITTFENYQDYNGIKIALDHKKAQGSFNLNFTNIKVVLE